MSCGYTGVACEVDVPNERRVLRHVCVRVCGREGVWRIDVREYIRIVNVN